MHIERGRTTVHEAQRLASQMVNVANLMSEALAADPDRQRECQAIEGLGSLAKMIETKLASIAS